MLQLEYWMKKIWSVDKTWKIAYDDEGVVLYNSRGDYFKSASLEHAIGMVYYLYAELHREEGENT